MATTVELSFPSRSSFSRRFAHAPGYSFSQAQAMAAGTGTSDDPMVSAALLETRLALLQDGGLDGLGGPGDKGGPPAMPAPDRPEALLRWGDQPRAALLSFELLGAVKFRCDKALAAASLESEDGLIAALTRPGTPYFLAQLPLVEAQTPRREPRLNEIVAQTQAPWPFFASVVGLQPGRHRHSIELIDAALALTYAVVMNFKHALACPRPHEYSAMVQPMIEVPQHATLPAGHATESHVMARLFSELVPGFAGHQGAVCLRRLAGRISENRVIAGVHFPVDLVAGRMQGDAIADFLVAAAGSCEGGARRPARFALPADAQGAQGSFDPNAAPGVGVGCTLDTAVQQRPSLPLLAQVFAQARKEWP